jgi:hypothetical protein
MDKLGNYKLGECIGSGAIGSVVKAVAPDGSAVAVKILYPHLSSLDEFVSGLDSASVKKSSLKDESSLRPVVCDLRAHETNLQLRQGCRKLLSPSYGHPSFFSQSRRKMTFILRYTR